MGKIVIVNEERCLGCRSCELACAMAHTELRTLAEAIRAGARLQARVHVEPAGGGAVPLQCRHCEDAPCLAVCPTAAIHRPVQEGPVLLDAERCIGCKFCLVVCPFGVIDLARDGKAMVKCDLCLQRTQAGEEPACVTACPTGALTFEEVTEFVRQRRRQAGALLAAAKSPVGRREDA